MYFAGGFMYKEVKEANIVIPILVKQAKVNYCQLIVIDQHSIWF